MREGGIDRKGKMRGKYEVEDKRLEAKLNHINEGYGFGSLPRRKAFWRAAKKMPARCQNSPSISSLVGYSPNT